MLAFKSSWASKLATAAVLAHLLIGATANPFHAILAARAGTIAPNQDCTSGSDCRSNDCIGYENFACQRLNTDGSYAENCDTNDNYLQNYCSGVAVGQKCANQGECANGRCNSQHKCVNTTAGKTGCLTDLGCSGTQVCRNSTCFAPASGSLYPRETCKSDSSCKSQRCVSDIAERFVGEGIYPTRPECDVFQQGQKGCRSFYDCYDALCLNITKTAGGTCKLGADGERCVANYQCQNVCSLNGVCYTPANGSLARYQPCTNNNQCISGTCYDSDFRTNYRPDFTRNDNSTFAWVNDYNCVGSAVGGKCGSQSDCAAGTCTKGICKGKPRGASCTDRLQCNSLSCTIPSGSKNGTCTIGAAYAQCSKNSDCYSGSCGTGSCPASCPTQHCSPVQEGQSCRDDNDVAQYDYCDNGISASAG